MLRNCWISSCILLAQTGEMKSKEGEGWDVCESGDLQACSPGAAVGAEGRGPPLASVEDCSLYSELHMHESALGPSGEGTPIGIGEGIWCGKL